MDLEQALLAAHARDDGPALVDLYAQVASECEKTGDTHAACFYMTHSYIYALEMAHPDTAALHQRLKEYGREA